MGGSQRKSAECGRTGKSGCAGSLNERTVSLTTESEFYDEALQMYVQKDGFEAVTAEQTEVIELGGKLGAGFTSVFSPTATQQHAKRPSKHDPDTSITAFHEVRERLLHGCTLLVSISTPRMNLGISFQ